MNKLSLALSSLFLFFALYLRQSYQPLLTPKPAPEATHSGNQRILSFTEAKKELWKLYKDHPYTFYCSCAFNGSEVDLSSCGYTPQKSYERAKRIEWEHIVPASAFGQSFPEWREGHPDCKTKSGKSFKGRKCTGLVSETYRKMEADLHNLVPSIGEINGMRSNFDMGLLPGVKSTFGNCETKIANNTIEPRKEDRGFVARAYKYMDQAYPGHGIISRKNRKLFEAWDQESPPTQFEIDRNAAILRLQGNSNPFIVKNLPENISQKSENVRNSNQ